MGIIDAIRRRLAPAADAVIVREYGRDSLLAWANLLVAPLLARSGRRVGVRSDDAVARAVQADAARLRARGYLVTKVERFGLPVPGAPDAAAEWQRVTYERISATDPARDAV